MIIEIIADSPTNFNKKRLYRTNFIVPIMRKRERKFEVKKGGYLISIIVPIYNVEKYLKKCIDSILNQTYENFELILVDDGSPDDCGKICDAYAQNDQRIKVIHKKNGGLSDARNAGIEIAKGEYIGFIDSDDYISPDMYKELMRGCLDNQADIAMCGRYVVSEGYEVIKKEFVTDSPKKYSSETAIGKLLLWDTCDSAAWDKLYRRSLFDEIRYPVGVMSEDYDVTCRLFAKANQIVHVGKALYYYVQRNGSITKQNFNRRRFETIYQVYNLASFVDSTYPELNNNMGYFLANHLISLERYSLRCNDVEYLDEMQKTIHECKKNMGPVIRCVYLTNQEKMKFIIRIAQLKVHILRIRG